MEQRENAITTLPVAAFLTHYFCVNFDLHKIMADLMRYQILIHITNHIYNSENPHMCL